MILRVADRGDTKFVKEKARIKEGQRKKDIYCSMAVIFACPRHRCSWNRPLSDFGHLLSSSEEGKKDTEVYNYELLLYV